MPVANVLVVYLIENSNAEPITKLSEVQEEFELRLTEQLR